MVFNIKFTIVINQKELYLNTKHSDKTNNSQLRL